MVSGWTTLLTKWSKFETCVEPKYFAGYYIFGTLFTFLKNFNERENFSLMSFQIFQDFTKYLILFAWFWQFKTKLFKHKKFSATLILIEFLLWISHKFPGFLIALCRTLISFVCKNFQVSRAAVCMYWLRSIFDACKIRSEKWSTEKIENFWKRKFCGFKNSSETKAKNSDQEERSIVSELSRNNSVDNHNDETTF